MGGMEIMSFNGEKNYRDYLKGGGRGKIFVSFSDYWNAAEPWVGGKGVERVQKRGKY